MNYLVKVLCFSVLFFVHKTEAEDAVWCSTYSDAYCDFDVFITLCRTFCGNAPTDGAWGKWIHWADCDTTCGHGKITKKRMCNNPSPSNGGKECTTKNDESGLEEFEYKDCSLKDCPVDGRYTEWSEFTECTKSCGGGVKYKKRCCTNPAPMYGGNTCTDESVHDVKCNTEICPVDGKWTAWEEWLQCTETCGETGVKTRKRQCSNPAKVGSGKDCIGAAEETADCNRKNCPIDGVWNDWTEWSNCTDIQYRTRCCNNPMPKYEGNNCEGEPAQVRSCGNPPPSCPTTTLEKQSIVMDGTETGSGSLVGQVDLVGKEYLIAFKVLVNGGQGNILSFRASKGDESEQDIGPNVVFLTDPQTDSGSFCVKTWAYVDDATFAEEANPFKTPAITAQDMSDWIKIEVSQSVQAGGYECTITVSNENGDALATSSKPVAHPYQSKNVNIYAGGPPLSANELTSASAEIKDLKITSKASKACPVAADVVYILDSSSTAVANFEKEKAFIKQIARAFPPKSQGGVILFASEAKDEISLGDNDDQDKFVIALEVLAPLSDTTDSRIDMALNLVEGKFSGKLDDKLVVLFTAGEQTVTGQSENPADLTDKMREKGTKVFVVGVGSNVQRETLAAISGGDYNFMHAVNWDELQNREFICKAIDLACRLLTDNKMLVKWDDNK